MWAHSMNASRRRHRLEDHLRGTAGLAGGFARVFGLGELASWAGLVHDGGKAWCAWQERLLAVEGSGARVGLDHKSFGVQLARQQGLAPVEWAVAGHHGGLTCAAEVDALFGVGDEDERRLRLGPWADSERVLRRLVPEIFTGVPALPAEFAHGGDRNVAEFVLRFLYSCLVDADALDTQAHRWGLVGARLGPVLDAEALFERLVGRRKEFLAGRPSAPMDALRESVFQQAVAVARSHEPGLFRLTAPTGAAKTIAAAAFALAHAAVWGKRRVIVAVPFITITEQNAVVYRRLLDDLGGAADPVVLEHHSNVTFGDGSRSVQRWQRLAAENWDARFVVTTTVQLFESLFGRLPSRMRKVHRIAESVVVLDEVQALPHRLLPQVADALRILTRRFGVSVVLCSATQPELAAFSPLRDLRATEIVADTVAVFRGARRVRWRWRVEPRPTLAQAVAEAGVHDQVLMVVNTVRDARAAYEQALEVVGRRASVRHLSTGMCPAHRRRVLAEVKGLLGSGAAVMVVSTSLVEAGVDLDFPVVYRAVAPPESQAQVAGRCNREGLLGPDGGLVVIFDPVDGGNPPDYAVPVQKARLYFGPGPDQTDPEDPDRLREFFQDLYRTLDLERSKGPAATIGRHRRVWDFRSVADGPVKAGGTSRDLRLAFRLILEDTFPVAVHYGDAMERQTVADCLAALQTDDPQPEIWRQLQPYITTIRRQTALRAQAAGLTAPVVGDLVEWRGEYDDGFGLVLDPRGEDIVL